MPLSGIFFVSLYHQSNRMTMFKKTDPNPQLDIFTAPSMQLGSRASKIDICPFRVCQRSFRLFFKAISRKIFTCGANCYVSLRMTTLVMLDSKYAPF